MQSLRKEQTPIKTEQRGVVNFCARLGRSPSETQALLQEAYKQDALRKAATRTYYKRFRTLGAAVYEDKRKSRGSNSRHSAAEQSDDDFHKYEYNSSEQTSSYLNNNWDPLISQTSTLNNKNEKEKGEYPNSNVEICDANNDDDNDFDDDLTDILEDSLQEDQRSVSECESVSGETNNTPSIAEDTYNETLSNITEESSKMIGFDTNMLNYERIECENELNNSVQNHKENENVDKYDQNMCIKCRTIIKDNSLSNQTQNVLNESNNDSTNIPQESVESKKSKISSKDLYNKENNETSLVNNKICGSSENGNNESPSDSNNISGSADSVDSPPHITRENAIRQPSAINWFIKLNGEYWKIKSYQVCI